MWEIADGATNVVGREVAKDATDQDDIGRNDAVIAVGTRRIGDGGRDVRQTCCQRMPSSLLDVLRIEFQQSRGYVTLTGMASEHANDIASLARTDTHQANRTWRSPLDRLTRLFLNQRQSQ